MEITEGMKVGHEFIELNPDPGRRIRDPMFERVVGVNNDSGFASYYKPPAISPEFGRHLPPEHAPGQPQ